MSGYEYSSVNRLETPHSYMYTKYEGPEFLVAYRQARRACGARLLEHGERLLTSCPMEERRRLRMILDRCGRVVSLSVIARGVAQDSLDGPKTDAGRSSPTAEALDALRPDRWIDTARAIESALEELSGDSDRRDAARARLNPYVARFEVTKKLYGAYSSTFKERRGVFDNLDVYAMFSLALGLYTERWSHLKFLNTALKVNDLLCSLPASAFGGFAALTTTAALTLEQHAIERLLTTKDIARGA